MRDLVPFPRYCHIYIYIYILLFLYQVSTRIPVPIPPPHQHCFISERDLSNFSPANVSHNLVCDVHLLNLLSLALQRVATFERCSNPQSEYYWVILRAKSTIESISHALANITRVHNDGLQDNTCGLPSLSALSSSGGQQRRCQVSNSLGSSPDAPEDRSRPARLRGQTTTQPAIRPPMVSTPCNIMRPTYYGKYTLQYYAGILETK